VLRPFQFGLGFHTSLIWLTFNTDYGEGGKENKYLRDKQDARYKYEQPQKNLHHNEGKFWDAIGFGT
jgi:hypothetical protein